MSSSSEDSYKLPFLTHAYNAIHFKALNAPFGNLAVFNSVIWRVFIRLFGRVSFRDLAK